MKWSELAGQQCSAARALSIIGDRWTLLILSDCFLGAKRFEEFTTRLGLSRAILSERLSYLETHGVLSSQPYQEKPKRLEYKLTPKGLALSPVVLSIVHWGDDWLGDEGGPPVLHKHTNCDQEFSPVMVCSQCGEEVTSRNVTSHARPEKSGIAEIMRGPVNRNKFGNATE